ncbi:MAG: hypothetical protein OXR82_11820 [Gammaproteobacteria bacterium]|nr:hypothetical protein [Gammaproteobacteria bacterium]MDE0259055.1 hypothetical protein [Gammaproteobacteria bacterium]
MIERFLGWLGETSWSVALLESLYVWPLVESTHVLTLGLFVGTTVMMDLRLTGIAFRNVPVTAFTGRLLPWTRIGFAIMTMTGLLLFYSQPLRYYHNIFFRAKVVVLMLAGANAAIFHTGVHRSAGDWDEDETPPRSARIAGAVSLTAWAVVVIAGRLIAYNWFDCDLQPQPGWVNRLAGCGVGGAGAE